jgi:hypothetical protein
VPFAYFKCVRWIEGGSDNAQFAQILETTAKTGVPRNYIFPSIEAYLKSGLATLPAEQACLADLAPPAKASENFLRRHGYFIIYLLAPLAWLIPAHLLWPILTTLAFLTLPLVAYLFLRRHGASPAASALFCAAVSLHPAWSQGLLHGQIYPDRLFLGLGAALILALANPRPRWLPITVLVLLSSAAATERSASIVGAFLILTALLYPGAFSRYKRYLLGAALILLSFVVVRLLTNADYSTFLPRSLSDLVSRFSIPGFAEHAGVFLLSNLGFLGLLAILEPRALTIAVMMMLPNIVGTIGGAEKTGWSTHYHTFYLPFLVWAAACGYVRLLRRTSSSVQTYVLAALVAIIAVLARGLFPYLSDRPRQRVAQNLTANAWPRVFTSLPSYFPESHRSRTQVTYDEIRRRVPLHAVVTASETKHPSLYKDRALYFYPIGLWVADYAIPPAVSYLGEANQRELNHCLLTRMAEAGYDIDHPMWAGQVQIYHRASRRSPPQPVSPARGLLRDFEELDASIQPVDTAIASQRISLNDEPAYITAGHHSLRKSFMTDGRKGVHYGGFTTGGMKDGPFAFDFWLDTKCAQAAMFLFLLDEDGKAGSVFVRDLASQPIPVGTRQTIEVSPGTGGSGFRYNEGNPRLEVTRLGITLDLRTENCPATFYIDNVRMLTGPPEQ